VVAPFTASPCETGKADLVLDRFTGIKRTDYVNEGGCVDCKVGALPENMILTARLSTEDSNMMMEILEQKDKKETLTQPQELLVKVKETLRETLECRPTLQGPVKMKVKVVVRKKKTKKRNSLARPDLPRWKRAWQI
jgi:hypothetical protein